MKRLALFALLLFSHTAYGEIWSDIALPSSARPPESPARWYRCYLRVPDRMVIPAAKDLWRDSMMLGFSDLPGPFSVWLNGTQIIEASESIAAEQQQRFKVPKGLLEKEVFNCLLIKLTEDAALHGLRRAPVYFGYHDELVLAGTWQTTVDSIDPEAATPQENAPSEAFFTEAQFRPARTVLDATLVFSPGKRVPPDEALTLLETDPDLVVESLLHEPEVAQPTHFSFDARGRLWVAQYRQYPFPAGLKMMSRDMYYRSTYDRVPPPPPDHTPGADLVSVHEDADGDGTYESHKVVLRGLNMANAVLHGRGGLWVMHTPYLLFYPDRDEDDVPDSDPEVRLAGFGLEDTHSVANGLAWGPDGWLYGAQGSTTTSRVTRPGIDPPASSGTYNEGCMVWRYHPDTREYEIFADGSGNTFGLSFDAEGRLFSGHNGGNTRGWHHIQDGLYLKQGKNPGKFGPPPNPYAFGELPMMESEHPVPRFSHMTIEANGTALPERFHGRFLGIDPLHHHLILSQRRRHGSTFATKDLGFPLRTEDSTFRPVYLANGPDGAVTVADFREEFIAHGQNYQGQIDPESGRLYRLRGKAHPLIDDRDLSSKRTSELIALLRHSNPWHRHTAARLLGERRDPAAATPLKALMADSSTHPALDALWALHQSGQRDRSLTLEALSHPAPAVRAWAIRLAGDARRLPTDLFEAILTLSQEEPDPEVRAQVLSTARRLPLNQAVPLVCAVTQRSLDETDPFIPLMAWFSLESHCGATPGDLLAQLGEWPQWWKAPLVRHELLPRLMRRFAAEGTVRAFSHCTTLLRKAPDKAAQLALLRGFETAFEGTAPPPLPESLSEALASIGKTSLPFRVRQGDPDALEQAFHTLSDTTRSLPERMALVRAFGIRVHAPAREALMDIARGNEDVPLRRAALIALQRYSHESIGRTLATSFRGLAPELQPTALTVLASRPSWAREMLATPGFPLEAMGEDVRARIQMHGDTELSDQLAARFPRETETSAPGSLAEQIEALRSVLQAAPGDPYQGEAIYNARCLACHRLFHKGGRVGPDLTAYQRDDLDTLLPSVLMPSLEIREGYEHQLVKTKDERVFSGFLIDESAHQFSLRTFDGSELTFARSEILEQQPAGRSLMPDGLLQGLTDQALRDLFAYLKIPQPISR